MATKIILLKADGLSDHEALDNVLQVESRNRMKSHFFQIFHSEQVVIGSVKIDFRACFDFSRPVFVLGSALQL